MEIPGMTDLVLLGSKDSGATYVGTDTELGQSVTVRVIRNVVHDDGSRFDYLIRAKGRISEIPDAAPILRTGVLPSGEPYLVRPHYESSLHSRIANGPLNERDAIEAMAPVARALEAAHAHDVIHDDIKPSNILLDSKNQAFVSDFGIVEYLASSASLSGAMLIPPFAPPERFQDAPQHPSADIYSFGATLFALLVGRPPFRMPGASSGAAEMHRIMGNDVPIDDLPNTTSQEMVDLIVDCMSKLPHNRPTAAELAEQLKILASPVRPVTPRQAAAPHTTQKPGSSRPAVTRPAVASKSNTKPKPTTNKSVPPPGLATARNVSSSGPELMKRIAGGGLVAFALLGIIAIAVYGSDEQPNLTFSETAAESDELSRSGTASVDSVSLWEVLLRRNQPSFADLGERTSLAAELDTDFGDASTVDLFTVFAVGNSFLSEAELAEITGDPGLRELTFSYHVVRGELTVGDLLDLDGQSLTTLSGEAIDITVLNGRIRLNGSVTLLSPVSRADNGVIYPIDGLLQPPSISGAAIGTTEGVTVAALRSGSTVVPVPEGEPFYTVWDVVIGNERGDFQNIGEGTQLQRELDPAPIGGQPLRHTVFMVDNDVLSTADLDLITRLPIRQERIFSYHVVPRHLGTDDLLRLDGQSVTTHSGDQLDITVVDGEVVLDGVATIGNRAFDADNGIVYVIDQRLQPPSTPNDASEAATPLSELQGITVWDAVNESSEATQFVAIGSAIGLQPDLEALVDPDGNSVSRTLFAPSNDALADLGQQAISLITADPNTASTAIGYHYLEEALTVEDLLALDGQAIPSRIPGQSIDITVVDGEVVLNGVARIVDSDRTAENGVVHVIDTWLSLLRPVEGPEELEADG